MSKQIMQQALDALEDCYPFLHSDEVVNIRLKAIAALEAELAKPEQPQTDLRKAAELALETLETADYIVDMADAHFSIDPFETTRLILALRQALAQPDNPLDIADRAYFAGKQAGIEETLAPPEQSIIPKFPEPFSQADLEIDPPESWDDGHKKTWVDLQVCQRNKIQLHKYAKNLRELLAQPDNPLDKKADNARELGLDYEPEQDEPSLPPVFIGVDVTPEGTHVNAFYRKPNAVAEMFYSEFHPLVLRDREIIKGTLQQDDTDSAMKALRQALAQPEQERNFCPRCGKRLGDGIHTCTPPEQPIIPEFPEPFTEADLDIYAPETWDYRHKKTWIDLQVCHRNKIQLHKYAKQLRELLAQPEQEPVAIIDDDGFAWGYGIEGGKLPSGTKVYTAPPKPDVTLTNKGKTEQDSFNRLIRIMGTFDLATGHADGWDDLLDSLEAELRDVLGHYREALKQAQPEQEPVAHAVIAGVLFDFMGWLTSRKDRLVLSASDEASPAVNAIQEFANMRGLSLDDAKVEDWQDMTTAPPKREWQGLTSEELFDIMIKHAGSPVGQVFAIEAKLREKNG